MPTNLKGQDNRTIYLKLHQKEEFGKQRGELKLWNKRETHFCLLPLLANKNTNSINKSLAVIMIDREAEDRQASVRVTFKGQTEWKQTEH